MRAPAFWWKPKPALAARLLQPAGLLYGAVTAARLAAGRPRPAGMPIICIGNPTVGGAGKTPTAIAVAAMLGALGRRPVFLTRGHGGRLRGPVAVSPGRQSSADVGDEPLLLAAHAPVIVSANRVRGARMASGHGDVIVMDDGFQNPSLRKDFSILVVDGHVGLGNGLCLPAGPLRMEAARQFEAADAVLVVGADERGVAAGVPAGTLLLSGRIDGPPPPALKDRRLVAFSGIGRPSKFFETLERAGLEIVARIPFPDHHAFTESEAAALLSHAARENAVLVSTEKDHVRLPAGGGSALADLRARTVPYPVSLQLAGESAAILADRLRAVCGGA